MGKTVRIPVVLTVIQRATRSLDIVCVSLDTLLQTALKVSLKFSSKCLNENLIHENIHNVLSARKIYI